MPAPADAAQVLHSLRWNVLPLLPRSKRPNVSTWERWRTEHQADLPGGFSPDSNVGVITGAVSGIVVVDADDTSSRDLVIDHVRGALERTPIARTRQGFHFYFAHPGGERPNRTHVGGVGLDVRADGGYVVAPPSVHESGDRYTWIVAPFEHAPIQMPASLVEYLWPPVPSREPAPSASAGHRDAYVQAAVEREVTAVRYAVVGTRNATLNTAAFNLGRFIETGELPEPYIIELLTLAATRNGLSEHEATRTIRSGLSAGRVA